MDYFELEKILVCPICRISVQLAENRYVCRGCSRVFPLRFGIPDFRIFPDPYIEIEAEVAKVSDILGDGNYTFSQLVDRYYEHTPEVSPKLQPHYKKGLKSGVTRADNFLDQMESVITITGEPLIDIGCGTSGLTLMAQKRYGNVIGVDIALRWLVIGKQQLREAGLEQCLICANAEALPFADNSFVGALSDSTLEHAVSAAKMLSEARRVTKPGGFFFLNTANRYSMLEAYTGFPLAGLLPRYLRWPVIEKICRTPYKLNPLSVFELQHLLSDITDLRIGAYRIVTDLPAEAGNLKKLFMSSYSRMLNDQLGNKFLTYLGLYLSVSGHFPGLGGR